MQATQIITPTLLKITTNGGETVLSDLGIDVVWFGGAQPHTLKLLAATSLPVGWPLKLINASQGGITVKNGAGDVIFFIPPNTSNGPVCREIILLDKLSVAGIWDLGGIPGAVLATLQEGYQPVIAADTLPTTATLAEVIAYLHAIGIAQPE